jgi:hypothetical protein
LPHRGQAGDVDRERRPLASDLDEPHRTGRQRQHERRLRERDRAQQRLDVEAVGDLDHRAEPVRQPERPNAGRRREHGKATRLLGPEEVVLDEGVQRLAHVGDGASIGTRRLHLLGRLGDQVLELDPIGLRVLGDRARRQVRRDAARVACDQQPLDLGTRRDVGVERQRLVRWQRSSAPGG